MKNKLLYTVIIFFFLLSVALIIGSILLIQNGGGEDVFSNSQEYTLLPVVDSVITDLKFDKINYDFNNLYNDTVVNVSFVVNNIGAEDLIIHYVKPDCNCTNLYLSKKVISPMDTAVIRLTINTEGKIGPQVLKNTLSANTCKRMYLLEIKMNVIRTKKQL